VPGVGTLACDDWSLYRHQPWTDFFASLDTGVTLHAYNHGVSLDDRFSWQQLLDEGEEFLKKLQTFVDNQRVIFNFLIFALFAKNNIKEPQRLLFICHGLGGVIAKKVRRSISKWMARKLSITLISGRRSVSPVRITTGTPSS
jgi:hypothetical protein